MKPSKGTNGKKHSHREMQDDIDQDDEGNDDCEQKSCQLGARQYKHPIAIHAGKPKNGLKEALRAGIGKIKRLSLCETTLEKATKSYGIDLVRFTQKNILRVYPKWTRVTSSNFNPLTGWMHEAQMVAFNLQVRNFLERCKIWSKNLRT
ncbi:phosphoinositide phospholipase C 2-like isoform X3 [Camellia sinensis]|uniref:phosphoinositide phospholipase C 2-like isoform X3 n=1 Tax=Camellia sinensis TaxID=4442 RepID=UPI001036E42F|nr:phosphoinositide phospholipase C 2-like isoform X3 [Camellia sinensis]